MGYGILIKCKCRQKELFLGVGMGYPSQYDKAMRDAKSGAYGKEFADLIKNTELAVIDAELAPYVCSHCGYIDSFERLDAYKPCDIAKAKKVQIGRWTVTDSEPPRTVEDLGYIPCWTRTDLEYGTYGDFDLIKKFEHFCPKCHKVMTEFGEVEVKCPKCKQVFESDDSVCALWD